MNNPNVDLNSVIKFLEQKLLSNSPEKAVDWVYKRLSQMKNEFSIRSFFLAFSAAFRFFGKQEVVFSKEEIAQADTLCPGWNPRGMRLYEIARVYIFLHLPTVDKAKYFDVINKLFGAADMGEQVVLYKSLIVYPFAKDFQARTAEGIRTNIKTVFEAIALDNPYPSKYLNEGQWNQLVLKAVFNGSPLYRIIGLDLRINATLSQQLSDYAHERWAAGRPVNPELWRVVAPFTTDTIVMDYKRLFDSSDVFDQQAAALACSQSNNKQALQLLDLYTNLKSKIISNELNWEVLSAKWYENLV